MDEYEPNLPNLFESFWRIFQNVARDPDANGIICVVDALDEYEESARRKFVHKLNQLYHPRAKDNVAVKFLVTSHPYQAIETDFDPLTIRLAGEEESELISREIDTVIKVKVPEIASQLKVSPSEEWFQPALMQHLSAIPHRTYLWLHLILEVTRLRQGSLCGGITPKKLRAAVQSLPRTVEDAYTAILEKSTDKNLAKKLLHIIVIARRPLSLEEMSIAMAIEDGSNSEKDLDLESPDRFGGTVRSLCGLFVGIEDGKIYLIHQTAKEFLICNSNPEGETKPDFWRHSLKPRDSNLILAKICTSYLHLSEFTYKRNFSQEWMLKEHRFLEYSAIYWAIHIRKVGDCEPAVVKLVLALCEVENAHFETWFNIWSRRQHWSAKRTSGMTGLIVVSALGLSRMARILLDNGANPNAATDQGLSALHIAMEKGYTDAARLLIEKGADVTIVDENGETALHIATLHGFTDVIRVLLKNEADVMAVDKNGETALHKSARMGFTDVIRLLLKNGADVTAVDEKEQTALHKATALDSIRTIRLLLEKGADVTAADKNEETALHRAAFHDSVKMIRLLLDEGIDVTVVDKNGETALHMSALNGSADVVRLLLDAKANPLIESRNGSTALDYAVKWYNKDVIQLLQPLTKRICTPVNLSIHSFSCYDGKSNIKSLSNICQMSSDDLHSRISHLLS